MPKDRDDGQLNQEEFSLESILAEFGSGNTEQRPEKAPTAPFDAPRGSAPEQSAPPPPEKEEIPRPQSRNRQEEAIPFPVRPHREEEEVLPKPGEAKPRGVVTAFPGPKRPAPPPLEDDEDGESLDELIRETVDNDEPPAAPLLEFPHPEPENRVAAGLDQLRRKADEFADHMYEGEGAASAKAVRRAERLIPGVDVEEKPAPVRERKPRKVRPAAPDTPPAELAKRYSKGLKAARIRVVLVFLILAALTALTVVDSLPLPVQAGGVLDDPALHCYIMGALQGLAMLLGADGLLLALARPFRGQMGMDTLTALGNLVVLIDALTLPVLEGALAVRGPFCAPAVLSLWCILLGNLQERRGQRLCCRTAAAASEPYLVTRDEGKWNNRDTYIKWSGPVAGFGSQVQGENGAQRIYRVMAPLVLLSCVLFALISSVGHERPRDFLWCLGTILTAAAPLSATLCFGLPWRRLSQRLSKSGAALAGWQGVVGTRRGSNLLLTDIDLFPVGSVSLNGVKIFGDFPIEKVVAVTATVIRDSGCGLEKVFHDLLRSQGAVYRRGEKLTAFEGGGLSEIIRNEQILVGSASFMVLMDVALPPGLKVKNAVFCAIDGELAGIFALNYHLPGTVSPAIDCLIHNRITPVLATRDFNLIPSMLRQRFKLPADKMEFPPIERRRELSDPEQEHSPILAAILCREGVSPYAEAVVGGKRLRAAVRLSAVLACLGSVAGALLSFYLTFVAAYASLTPSSLMVFLLMWLVPVPLIAGWVDRY